MARNPHLKSGVAALSTIRDVAHTAKCEAHAERREVERAARLIKAHHDLAYWLDQLRETIAKWQDPRADAADAKGGAE